MASLKACIAYGAVSAKAHVLKRGLLKEADYLALTHKKSVAEVCAYLKNETSYREVLANVNENNIHRDELERLIKTAYFAQAVQLISFDHGANRPFYQYVYVKAELDMLKNILRNLANDERPCYDIPPSLKRQFTVDFDRLIDARDIPEFLEILSGSRYERIIAPLISRKEHQNLFSVEMTLDMFYYQWVEKLRQSLPGALDRKLLQETLSTELDVLNLFWIYRCKKYFNLPRELIYSYLIPNRGRLKKESVIFLVESESAEAFLAAVRKTPYARVFENCESEFFHRQYAELVYALHRKMFRLYPYSVLAVVSYLHLKETEFSNIVAIIEGIRYGLSPAAIRPYIISLSPAALPQ